MEPSTDYYENLRTLLKAKFKLSEANSVAGQLTKAARLKEKEKYKQDVKSMLNNWKII